jgi:hypothetical protein
MSLHIHLVGHTRESRMEYRVAVDTIHSGDILAPLKRQYSKLLFQKYKNHHWGIHPAYRLKLNNLHLLYTKCSHTH